MKPVLREDLYQFQFVSSVAYAPDGRHAIFSKHQADAQTNGYHTQLWLLDPASGACSLLAARGEAKGALWLDAHTVLFTSGREPAEGKDPQTTYYRIDIRGGEAQRAFTVSEKVTGAQRVDDGRLLLTLSRKLDTEPDAPEGEAQEHVNFEIFDELPFWFNGRGVINRQRSVLALYDLASGALSPLTPADCDASEAAISPDGRWAVCSGCAFRDVRPQASDLLRIDLTSGNVETLVASQGRSCGSPLFLDDHTLFYSAYPHDWPGQNPRYFILDLDTGETRQLPFFDAAIGSTVGTDASFGGGFDLRAQNGKAYCLITRWGNTQLVSIDRQGTLEVLCDAEGGINGFDIYGSQVLMTAFRGQSLAEIYALDLADGRERALTHFNQPYLDTHAIIPPERFTYQSRNGYEMEGFVIKPAGYISGQRYPGVLQMHGGPKVVFGGIFHHEMQCLASLGYFVFYTNPRGADGRGEDFANLTGRLGTIDFDDFMEFTDQVIARYPDLIPERIGICGGSYGGFMCNWMIGHTQRYAAAVSQRSISNYMTKSLCTDIGFSHNMAQLGTTPWEDFDTCWEHSPLKMAHRATTPTLFVQSDEDYRCWMSDAVQMFSALKRSGVDTRLVLFHGENHELSRSGKPQNRISRLRELTDWFDSHLK